MGTSQRTTLLRYAGAVAIILFATIVRFWLETPLAGGGFMVFFVAVIIASWFGGLGPSLSALVLSVVLSAWFFPHPQGAPREPLARGLAGLGIFFFTGLTTAMLSESLRRAQRRAETADRRKDEFLAILAHELRNPLAPIVTALEIARQSAGDETAVARAHEIMGRQVRHLVRLVDDLLDVSRIARNKIDLRKERIDLQKTIERAVETSRGLIDAKGHELTVHLPDAPIALDADPVRLSQIVANLLNNAAKYTPPGGKIDLSANANGNEVEIRVRDTGIGIAPDMLPIVFELFMQAAPPDGIKGGLGIGLTLVKSLVELMGGSVEARSEGLGKGSEFVIRLPRPRQDDASLAAPQTVSPAGSPIESRRIFVVDDNADAAETLSAMLRLDGHDVTMFQTARSALDAAETIAPEVVLLDLGMPEMDGIELARQLRSVPATADATLIAVTGWGQPADRERTRLAGIDHHLVKPIDAGVLRELLMQSPVRKEDGLPRPSPSMVTG